ncbi:MAG: histidinol dehydrogenase [Phycisphaeraceae bacterium]|nr:histidinol dehydrogenase [Phycisphaeraceae bacterium]MCW5763964.1 histidinol dehydrogenase [Phycisphaeraceae bacterium]
MIIPSIDLMQGSTVQLVEGREKVLDAGDPRPIIDRFALVGEVAVIDLDAALSKGSNEVLIRQLLHHAPCRVGGGIRSEQAAIKWLDAGAAKVILGTAATPDILRNLPRNRVIAALDARDGNVVVEGWTKPTNIPIEERIDQLRDYAAHFLITFVEREGRMQGLDIDRVRALVKRAGPTVRITIAGGVRSPADIANADAAGADAQVGMALYTGAFDLAQGFCAPLRSDRPDNLWPTIVTDERGTALGLTYSNLQSLRAALDSKTGVYFSRSRNALWHKGQSSGSTQKLLRIDTDCDRDTLRFTVTQSGTGFCHTGDFSCFGPATGLTALNRTIATRITNATPDSYTARLIADPTLLRAKLLEEATELADSTTPSETAHEAADLIYFALVTAAARGSTLQHIEQQFDQRASQLSRKPGNAKPTPTHTASASQDAGPQDAGPQDAGTLGAHTTPESPPTPNAQRSGSNYHNSPPTHFASAPLDAGPLGAHTTPESPPTSNAQRSGSFPPQPTDIEHTASVPQDAGPLGAHATPESPSTPNAQRSRSFPPQPTAIEHTVASIISSVRTQGPAAVRNLAIRFGERSPTQPLVLTPDDMHAALHALNPDDRALLERTAERIRTFALAQRASITETSIPIPGGTAGHTIEPVASAGCYAPAGLYPLPSSVLMTAITARAAGVPRVVVASPGAHPLNLAAAAIAGADHFLAVGGAHAIAALALGLSGPTGDALDPVDIIVGPGNAYVTAAKRALFGTVGIDMLAGPSELLILADSTADPRLIAADLLAQAEHDENARANLVTTDPALIHAVRAELDQQLLSLPSRHIAAASLASSSLTLARDLEDAIAFTNRAAPEHLQIMTADPHALATRIRNAGAIFLGHASAEVLGDYAAGPNHTLPTNKTARFSAGLSVSHFLRLRTYISITDPAAAAPLRADAIRLANLEGLQAHANAAQLRN